MTPEKRETAIKWLTEEVRSLRMAPKINGCGPENWQDQLEIMETSLEAVREHTDLLARAEEAEQKVNELERALSDASKIVNTMQESTIPFYRRRAEEAEADNARLRELVEADRDGRCSISKKMVCMDEVTTPTPEQYRWMMGRFMKGEQNG